MTNKTTTDSIGRLSLYTLESQRDSLILSLWRTFSEITKLDTSREMPDEDLDLWVEVTKHSAIQNKLEITR